MYINECPSFKELAFLSRCSSSIASAKEDKQIRDRCYDVKNIFTQKIGENIGVFCLK
jgi:hypothetical protein